MRRVSESTWSKGKPPLGPSDDLVLAALHSTHTKENETAKLKLFKANVHWESSKCWVFEMHAGIRVVFVRQETQCLKQGWQRSVNGWCIGRWQRKTHTGFDTGGLKLSGNWFLSLLVWIVTEGEEAVVHSAKVGWFCSWFGSWGDLKEHSLDRGTETDDEEYRCLVGDEDVSFCDFAPTLSEYLGRMQVLCINGKYSNQANYT